MSAENQTPPKCSCAKVSNQVCDICQNWRATPAPVIPREFWLHENLGHAYNLDEIPVYRDKTTYIRVVTMEAYRKLEQELAEAKAERDEWFRQMNVALAAALVFGLIVVIA